MWCPNLLILQPVLRSLLPDLFFLKLVPPVAYTVNPITDPYSTSISPVDLFAHPAPPTDCPAYRAAYYGQPATGLYPPAFYPGRLVADLAPSAAYTARLFSSCNLSCSSNSLSFSRCQPIFLILLPFLLLFSLCCLSCCLSCACYNLSSCSGSVSCQCCN